MAKTVHLEFSGGMELLFGSRKKITTALPAAVESMRDLIVFTRDTLLEERAELFAQGDTVRPGILVLINEADWELEGELEYRVQDGDTILFISTLHGG
ncbi:ubiquitin-related modifier 1 [Zopfochytrium polystomum]|nr:ubiquitin-related modifier 1 [Zopfochytrium polystomum]